MALRSRMTLADLDALPDDGHRYELIDGEVFVTPAPSGPHSQTVSRLFLAIDAACPADMEVLAGYTYAPPGGDRRLIPDICVVRFEDYRLRETTVPPLLAVEVLSPSNVDADLSDKLAAYEDAGVPSYWLVEPIGLSVAVLERDDDGRYQLVAEASGDQALTVDHPFPVEIVPASLRRLGRLPIDAAMEPVVDLPAAVRAALARPR